MAKKKDKVSQSQKDPFDIIRVNPDDTEEKLAKVVLTPRPNEKVKGELWCPYCATWSKFGVIRGSGSSYKRSRCCGISTEDFYIKTYNNLWENMKKR